MKAWEPILGKVQQKEAQPHAVKYLSVSRGGQGPSAPITRMSRGRGKEMEQQGQFSPRTTLTTTAGSKAWRTHSTGFHSEDQENKPAPQWYMQECEFKYDKGVTVYKELGNDIGVERIIKSMLAAAEKSDDQQIKALMAKSAAPELKQLLAYLLGLESAPVTRKMDVWKVQLRKERMRLKMTEDQLTKVQNMFLDAVAQIQNKERIILSCKVRTNMFKKELMQSDDAVKDKKWAYWEVLVPGVKAVTEQNHERLLDALCKSLRALTEPATSRMVQRVFSPSALNCRVETVERGVILHFEVKPELYEDRLRCKDLDLKHIPQFMKALIQKLNEFCEIDTDFANAAIELLDVPDEFLKLVDPPLIDVEEQEKEVKEPVSPVKLISTQILRSPEKIAGDAESQAQVHSLQKSLKMLTEKYAADVDRMQQLLKSSKERILELEALEDQLPDESRQAQALIHQITKEEVKRTASTILMDAIYPLGSDMSPASTVSMQMIEACPTPRTQADMSALLEQSEAAMPGATADGMIPSFVRLEPGEDIDAKLRNWIKASQRLIETNKSYAV